MRAESGVPVQFPSPGNAIRLKGGIRDLVVYSVDHNGITVLGRDRGRLIPMSLCSRRGWEKYASDGAVIIK